MWLPTVVKLKYSRINTSHSDTNYHVFAFSEVVRLLLGRKTITISPRAIVMLYSKRVFSTQKKTTEQILFEASRLYHLTFFMLTVFISLE